MFIVSFLALLVIIPFLMILIGLVQLFNSDMIKKKRGRNLFAGGILLLLVEILIGYSICSNMHFGGGAH